MFNIADLRLFMSLGDKLSLWFHALRSVFMTTGFSSLFLTSEDLFFNTIFEHVQAYKVKFFALSYVFVSQNVM